MGLSGIKPKSGIKPLSGIKPRSIIKPIITVTGSGFYQRIMQKYQSSKKYISGFPSMVHYEEKMDFLSKKIDMILKFNFRLNQQIIVPLLVFKDIPIREGRILRFSTEKKALKFLFKPKDIRNTNHIARKFSQILKIIQRRYESEVFLHENNFYNSTKASSFLNSLNSIFEIIKNTQGRILESLFLNDSNIFYQQNSALLNSISLNSNILNYTNKKKFLNMQIFGEDTYSKLFNFAKNSTFIYKGKKLNYWSVFEGKSPLTYLGEQNVTAISIEKNIPVFKEILSPLDSENIILHTLLKPKDVQNSSNVTNIPQTAFKITKIFKIKSGLLKTGNIFTNRTSFSSFLGHFSELLFNSAKASMSNVFKKHVERFLPLRFSMIHSHDPFIKSMIFKAEKTTTKSNGILEPLHLSKDPEYNLQATNSTYSRYTKVSHKIFNEKNNEKIPNSLVLKEKIINYRLNSIQYSDLIERYWIIKNHFVSENEISAFLLHDNLLFNKIQSIDKLLFNESNMITVNKPIVKNDYGSFEHERPSYLQTNHNYKISHENLVFKDQGYIEQEIEQIKKIITETKKSIAEKTVPVFDEAVIKKYLDINRISSHVYQNIERTIRMERERRGM